MYLTCAVLLGFLLDTVLGDPKHRSASRLSHWAVGVADPKKSCGACSPRRKAARPSRACCCG